MYWCIFPLSYDVQCTLTIKLLTLFHVRFESPLFLIKVSAVLQDDDTEYMLTIQYDEIIYVLSKTAFFLLKLHNTLVLFFFFFFKCVQTISDFHKICFVKLKSGWWFALVIRFKAWQTVTQSFRCCRNTQIFIKSTTLKLLLHISGMFFCHFYIYFSSLLK